jgi:hypothetical protein
LAIPRHHDLLVRGDLKRLRPNGLATLVLEDYELPSFNSDSNYNVLVGNHQKADHVIIVHLSVLLLLVYRALVVQECVGTGTEPINVSL